MWTRDEPRVGWADQTSGNVVWVKNAVVPPRLRTRVNKRKPRQKYRNERFSDERLFWVQTVYSIDPRVSMAGRCQIG